MKSTLTFSIVMTALITQTAGAAGERNAFGGQVYAPQAKAAAAPAPTWGRKKGCNVQDDCWDDTVENYIGADAGGEEEVTEWLKSFDLVVVIDKADQTLLAYRNDGSKSNPKAVVALQGPTSTGDEGRECHFEISKTPDHQGAYWATSTNPIHKHTPTGYFVPTAVKADYYSKKYRSNMENAVAWLEEEGYYTHKFPDGTEDKLGTPDSHGCIRMKQRDSRDLATMVLMTGAPFDPARDSNLRASCWQDEAPGAPQCTPDADKDRMFYNYFRNAQNGVFPAHLKPNLPRPKTYSDRPDVMVVHRNGTVELDKSGNAAKQKANFNTLYIVKDSNLDPEKGPKVPPPITCGAQEVRKKNARLNAEYKKAGNRFTPPQVDEVTGTAIIQPPNSGFQLPNLFGGGKNFFNWFKTE